MDLKSTKLKLEKTTFVKGTINYLKEQGNNIFTKEMIDDYEEYYVDSGNIIIEQRPLEQILKAFEQLKIMGEKIQILGPIPNLELHCNHKCALRQILSQYDAKKEQLQGRQYILK